MSTRDPAEETSRRILADIAAGRPWRRPDDWPSDDEISAAAERAGDNNHCDTCRRAS